MKRNTLSDVFLAAVTAVIFVFLFALTIPRPQPVAPVFAAAGIGDLSRGLP